MNSTKKPWIVLGGGGHAGVLIELLQLLDQVVIGFTDPTPAGMLHGVGCLGEDSVIDGYAPGEIVLANGLGSVGNTGRRMRIFRYFTDRGYSFAPIVHPSSVVARSVRLGQGTQLMAGVVVQSSCRLGDNVLVNTKASVGHDCVIEPHVHVASGATISGGVVIGEGTHIGTGANIIQGVRIGRQSTVGAGALVLADVPDGVTVVGVPATVRSRSASNPAG